MKPSFPAAPHENKVKNRVGVLLLALGTPDAATPGALRRYLAEFLSDPRVIEFPRLLWLPILYGPILTFRPKRSAKAYAQIWNTEKDESPLRTITRDQADELQTRLGDDVLVRWTFRYGSPNIQSVVEEMREAGVDKIVFFPLYPQYSATTTATAADKFFDALKTLRWQPAIRTVPSYFDDRRYIAALAESVRDDLKTLDWTPERILASYHSIPHAYWDRGDPYPCHCFKTTRLLGEALHMGSDHLLTSFQSRVGRAKWVSPYSIDMVRDLAREGVKKLAVMSPGFSADCVETLEEIDMELRDAFLEAGGTHFHYIPALNAGDAGMAMLEAIVRQEGSGWL